MKKAEKVYHVTFCEYTNSMRNTVSDDSALSCDKCYLHIPKEGLLVRESELEKYRIYGDGYESIKLAGSMYFEGEDNGSE